MRNYLLLGAIICILLSCNQLQQNNKEMATVADSTYNLPNKNNAAADKTVVPKRTFLKTADIKFKVKDVVNSTYNIENICNAQGGFVTYSNLVSNFNNKILTPVSVDSSVETSNFSVTNSIIIRVPSNKLDTVLKAIAANVDYLDYRIIKSDDVSLQLLTNELTQNRIKKNETRLITAINSNNKKLIETTTAEELLLTKQEQSDNSKIENLSLADQVNFSTVNLVIYQNEVTQQTMFANPKAIKIYDPSFGSKIIDSFLFGWSMVVELLVFLSKFWAIGLAIFLLYWAYKWYKRKLTYSK